MLLLPNRTYQRHILAYWKKASKDQHKRGKAWYPDTNRLCQRIADQYGLPVQHVAGILAALSPVCAWEFNVLGMYSLIKTGYMPNVASTYPANIKKAERILAGENPASVLGGDKVKSFYACILRPHGLAVCIDRHTGAIATGEKWGKRKSQCKPLYREVRKAYQAVARHLKQSVSVVQATTWLVKREELTESERLYTTQSNLYGG